MLPLGGAWTGACRAVPDEVFQPDEPTLRTLCNLGYARGNCPRFPPDYGPDAVRFTISRDDGSSLRIYYVVERDHHPFAHGTIEYTPTGGALVSPPAEGLFMRQAQAYAESYLRRKQIAPPR